MHTVGTRTPTPIDDDLLVSLLSYTTLILIPAAVAVLKGLPEILGRINEYERMTL